ncbi:MAG: aminotransferase [Pseudomonadota bacterium]|nr:aminotransferase [Pseudomonadota bacterium]
MNINPLLVGTTAPPIPEAKSWAARYDGAAGPLIDLSQAVPGYSPHPELLRRLGVAASTRESASYGDIAGDPDLRAAYAEHVSAIYGASVAAGNVAITAGCNQAFFVALIALARAGDAVLLPSPWYFNHRMTLDMLGIEAVPLPCRARSGFVPEVEDARPLIHPRVRAIVLVTPNNPTGAIYPPATIAAFQALAAEHGIALVLDETYRDFIGPGLSRPHGAFTAADWEDRFVQLYSFSKSYCIPGQRAGALIAGVGFVEQIAKILDCLQICAPRTPQLALPWAIPALADWRAEKRGEILARAEAFRTAAGRIEGWRIASLGAYFAYFEHPYHGRSGNQVCEWLAREFGVLCLPGSYFGPEQERFVRVAFANVDAAQIRAIPERLRLGAAATDAWIEKSPR